MVRRKRVHPKEILRVSIPLPGLHEQQRVAERLARVSNQVSRTIDLAGGTLSTYGSLLPGIVGKILQSRAKSARPLAALAEFVNDIVHPGDDPNPATSFVGLQHVESHTGRRLGESVLGGEKVRKFRFAPGDIVYGYLRPNLNKEASAGSKEVDPMCGSGARAARLEAESAPTTSSTT
jgi:hypothetical protein